MKISYGITVHNEADELNRLLEILIHKTDPDDEIVICVDGDDDGVCDADEWLEDGFFDGDYYFTYNDYNIYFYYSIDGPFITGFADDVVYNGDYS